jgi:hypothetical protein
MFSHHLIDLRVWNEVNSNCRHCSMISSCSFPD